MNQEAVLALVSRRLGDFLGDGAMKLSQEELGAVPLSFYGISQGAILGAGYTEFSSLVGRACLRVFCCLLFSVFVCQSRSSVPVGHSGGASVCLGLCSLFCCVYVRRRMPPHPASRASHVSNLPGWLTQKPSLVTYLFASASCTDGGSVKSQLFNRRRPCCGEHFGL